jgi:hypothetical protein
MPPTGTDNGRALARFRVAEFAPYLSQSHVGPFTLLFLLLLLSSSSSSSSSFSLSTHRPFLPASSSLEQTVFPTAQASRFRLHYLPCYV